MARQREGFVSQALKQTIEKNQPFSDDVLDLLQEEGLTERRAQFVRELEKSNPEQLKAIEARRPGFSTVDLLAFRKEKEQAVLAKQEEAEQRISARELRSQIEGENQEIQGRRTPVEPDLNIPPSPTTRATRAQFTDEELDAIIQEGTDATLSDTTKKFLRKNPVFAAEALGEDPATAEQLEREEPGFMERTVRMAGGIGKGADAFIDASTPAVAPLLAESAGLVGARMMLGTTARTPGLPPPMRLGSAGILAAMEGTGAATGELFNQLMGVTPQSQGMIAANALLPGVARGVLQTGQEVSRFLARSDVGTSTAKQSAGIELTEQGDLTGLQQGVPSGRGAFGVRGDLPPSGESLKSQVTTSARGQALAKGLAGAAGENISTHPGALKSPQLMFDQSAAALAKIPNVRIPMTDQLEALEAVRRKMRLALLPVEGSTTKVNKALVSSESLNLVDGIIAQIKRSPAGVPIGKLDEQLKRMNSLSRELNRTDLDQGDARRVMTAIQDGLNEAATKGKGVAVGLLRLRNESWMRVRVQEDIADLLSKNLKRNDRNTLNELNVTEVINGMNTLLKEDKWFAQGIADDLPEIKKTLEAFKKITTPLWEASPSPYAAMAGFGVGFQAMGGSMKAGVTTGILVGFAPQVIGWALSTQPGRRLITRALRNNKGVYDRNIAALVSTYALNTLGQVEFMRMQTGGAKATREFAPDAPPAKVKPIGRPSRGSQVGPSQQDQLADFFRRQ